MARKRRHQPRVQGTSRVPRGTALLEEIEAGIQSIADHEGKSASWVLAEIVCMFFGRDIIGTQLRKPGARVLPYSRPLGAPREYRTAKIAAAKRG
jgi:hypothetical protein